MSLRQSAAAEVFSVQEIARAAGVSAAKVHAVLETRRVIAINGFVAASQAVRCVRLLRRSEAKASDLFAPPAAAPVSPAAGILGSGALHLGMLALLALVTALGFTSAEEKPPERMDPPRLVFVATPGPGGGGGGGGLRQLAPPPKAQMQGVARLRSPVPPPKPTSVRKPEPRPTPPRPVAVVPQPAPRPVEPPPPAPRPAVTPQVVAPVVTASADPRDRAGVLTESPAETESQGSGSGAGVGTGQGSGIDEGTGAGIGAGSGGGTGGGPYRGGSGITPPELLHEVRPEYTDDARRQNLTGDVVLEIVVRRDGSVGDVKVIRGLGAGLDRRAIDAVRQWKFAPARRHGTPIDLFVEVAVEFKLR